MVFECGNDAPARLDRLVLVQLANAFEARRRHLESGNGGQHPIKLLVVDLVACPGGLWGQIGFELAAQIVQLRRCPGMIQRDDGAFGFDRNIVPGSDLIVLFIPCR